MMNSTMLLIRLEIIVFVIKSLAELESAAMFLLELPRTKKPKWYKNNRNEKDQDTDRVPSREICSRLGDSAFKFIESQKLTFPFPLWIGAEWNPKNLLNRFRCDFS